MSSSYLFLLGFLTVALTVHALMHYYFWQRMVRDTGLSRTGQQIGSTGVLLLFLLLPTSRIVAKWFSVQQLYYLLWFAYLWLGMLMLFVFFFLFTDSLKILFWLYRCFGAVTWEAKQQSIPNQDRRRFLAQSIALSAAVTVLGLSAFGVKKCLEPPTVNRLPVKISGLPSAFKGFSIVQISDVHIGTMSMRSELDEVVKTVNKLQPNLIAITGDLVDGDPDEITEELAPLAVLKAQDGVFFVTGNHEYYSGVERWLPEIKKLGITVLTNSRTEIRRKDEVIIVAGVNDQQAGRFG